MTNNSWKFSVFFSFFMIFMVSAEALDLNLTDFIEEAKTNNPEILAAKERYEAVKQRISGFYYLMEPWLGVEFDGDMRMYSISQEFPFPTKLSTKSNIAKAEAQQLFEEYQSREREIIKIVKNTYGQLFVINKEIEAMKKSRELLNQIFKIAQKNYALNKVSQTDALRSQVELSKIENELLNLNDEKKTMVTELNALLNRTFDSPVGDINNIEIIDMPLALDELNKIAKDNHPVLKSFRFVIKRAEASLSLAKQDYLPDFMVKFEQQEIDGEFLDKKFMFGLTLPLWFWGKQQNMVNEMKAEKKMTEADYKAMENMILTKVSEAKINVNKQKRQIELYKNTILPQVEATLKSSLRAYETNQVDFMTVLDNENMLIENELDYYRAQADYFVAIAELEAAVGMELVNR